MRGELRDGLLADFEGEWQPKPMRADATNPDHFNVDGFVYDRSGNPVEPDAPRIVKVWDLATTPKGYVKTRRARITREQIARAAGLRSETLRKADPRYIWLETVIDTLPNSCELTRTCKACGLRMVEPVGRMIREGRLSGRTIRELEAALYCSRQTCSGSVAISKAGQCDTTTASSIMMTAQPQATLIRLS